MDKEKFLKWIDASEKNILKSTTNYDINNSERKAYLTGVLNILDEIKLQVTYGKFE